MIKIFTDAATKGNPGPTGLGIIIITNHKQIQLAVPVDKERWTITMVNLPQLTLDLNI